MGFFEQEPEDRRDGGIDDWLMSYADMITLILCFFALLLAISIPKQQKIEQAQEEVAEAFANATKHKKTDSAKGIPVDVQASPQMTGTDLLENLPSILDRYHDSTARRILVEQEGQRIQTIEMDSSLFFAAGAADLSDSGKTALSELAGILQKHIYEGYYITIEGHTDDSPISTSQFPSNWELSAARASAVVRHFIDIGIDAKRLRAAGYADTKPKLPHRDQYNNPLKDNQRQNRRVVITLEKLSLIHI